MKEIVFEKNELINLESSLNKEIIETSTEGAYATTTLTNCNTRKYHGLFIVNQPKIDDEYHVLLSSLDETIINHNFTFHLALHKFPNNTYVPKGHKYIESYDLIKIPRVIYRIGDIVFEKEFCFLSDNRLLIRYFVREANEEVILRLNPFLAFRQRHQLSKVNTYVDTSYQEVENGIKIRLYKNYDSLYMQFDKKINYIHSPDWYYNFEYLCESNRGYDSREDLITTGYFEAYLNKGDELFFISSLNGVNPRDIKKEFKKELGSREPLDSFDALLRRASNMFFVNRGNNLDVLAGYPWFGRWGRDSFIALPGLCIGLNNKNYFIRAIDTLIRDMKNGLFPNMGEAYNSVDAPLWFFWALQKYVDWTGEKDMVWNKYKNTFINILKSYRYGENQGIEMLDNGLIWSGIEGKALTWMDAVVDGSPVTQRKGLCVEINSLWYNAIKFCIELAENNSDSEFINEWSGLSSLIEDNFKPCFWSKDIGYLADYIDGEYKDFSVRPNMIFACSLKYTCLSEKIRGLIIDRIKKELLTPIGIRTLSPTHKNYKDTYSGNQAQRDNSYHQGIAWPWLLGHFIEGYLKINKEEAIGYGECWLEAFEMRIKENGVGTIGEISDGVSPFNEGGCYNQAWSVAEVMRIRYMLSINKTNIV